MWWANNLNLSHVINHTNVAQCIRRKEEKKKRKMVIKSTSTNPLKFYSVINFWFIVSTIDNIFLNLLHIFNSVVILYLLKCQDTSYSIISNICVFVCIFKHLCIKHWVKFTHWSSILGSYCCLLIALYKSCFENWNKSQFINWYLHLQFIWTGNKTRD